jgi:hypothetical protein
MASSAEQLARLTFIEVQRSRQVQQVGIGSWPAHSPLQPVHNGCLGDSGQARQLTGGIAGAFHVSSQYIRKKEILVHRSALQINWRFSEASWKVNTSMPVRIWSKREQNHPDSSEDDNKQHQPGQSRRV